MAGAVSLWRYRLKNINLQKWEIGLKPGVLQDTKAEGKATLKTRNNGDW